MKRGWRRRGRVVYAAVVVLLLAGALGAQAVLAGVDSQRAARASTDQPEPGNTLISTQGYDDNGELIEVTPEGEVVWEYAPEDSRVFDAEVLDDGNVLVSVATLREPARCPEWTLRLKPGQCVENRVLELDYGTQEPVWSYTWYDVYARDHEVHDADRLATGETAIVDMGNDRAFVVNREGEVTWEWKADEHLGAGTAFEAEYGGDPNPGGEEDWTHINDIDRLENGNFQLSIRNFDSVIEVDRASKEVVGVYGRPGNRSLLYEQHNPDRLESAGTILVADSENDRVVEYALGSGERVWAYGGDELLTWPRDADRLPDGGTLITDSQRNRVIEVDEEGEVVWEYRGVAFAYSADRIGVPEDATGLPPGGTLDSRVAEGPLTGTLSKLSSYARFVVPGWVGAPELLILNSLLLLAGGGWLLVELRRARSRPT
jgi:hypothetical protein